MTTATVYCPRSEGRALFHCRDYQRVFLISYTCKTRKPSVKEQITEIAFNGAGVEGQFGHNKHSSVQHVGSILVNEAMAVADRQIHHGYMFEIKGERTGKRQ
ncbi:IS1-like element transposase [Escherichia coli]